MRIAIIAPGSRGDVQPYVALAKGLQDAGHKVRILTHQNFENFVRSNQLDYWTLRGNVQEVAESQEMRALLEKGKFLAIARFQADAAQRAAVEWAEDGLAACEGMELIIAGIGGLFMGVALAEKLRLSLVQAHYVPFTPTKEFPGALFPQIPFELAVVNYLSHVITRQIMWQGFRAADRISRVNVLGLPAAPLLGPYHSEVFKGVPVLYGFSPSVIPHPPDWGAEQIITGYWFLDDGDAWMPSPDLVDFLEAGPAPIYIGFGSMSSRDPEETTQTVIDALRMTRQRAVLLSGWGGMQASRLPETIFLLESVSHSWLFPRMSAVVHHGGAGTTAAGFRAGVPTVVIPFFGDQPFWGARVAELGVGPKPIPRKKMTSENLARAIEEAVTNDDLRRRAKELGDSIRAEDGIAKAVEIIEHISRDRPVLPL